MPTAKVTISRNNNNEIHFFIEDDTSHVTFVDARLTLEDFAMLLTGLGQVPAKATYQGLEYVGKKRIIEKRTITMPNKEYGREKCEQWLKENGQEEGWILDLYLGSQSSMSTADNGQTMLHYSVYKFVEVVDSIDSTKHASHI